MTQSLKIGIDVGGTFTDMFLVSADGGAETFKVLSTPEDPSIGVLDGLRLMADSRGIDVEELARQTGLIVHGTTVTTNAVLTGSAKAFAGALTIGTHRATTMTSAAVAVAAQAVPKAQGATATIANAMTSASRQQSAAAIQRPRRPAMTRAATPTSHRPRTRASAATRARPDRTHLPLVHLPFGT